MKNPVPISRRSFLATSSKVLGAAALAPLVLPQNAFGANERLSVAWIGLGGQGARDLRRTLRSGVDLVAVCDCDVAQMDRDVLSGYPDVKRYRDFREMFAQEGDRIDAVGISTTDHTHFPAAVMAIHQGKHVFVQKPLTHSIWEARTLREMAVEKGVVTQMGNQGHASEGARLVKEWVEAGLVGDIREVIVWTNRPAEGVGFGVKPQIEFPPPMAPPGSLDWNLWLGPSTVDVGYHTSFHPSQWRRWWDFGAGGLGDIGCHTIDTAYWALDLGFPTKIEVEMNDEVNPIHTPLGSVVTFHFPARGAKPPVRVKWYEGPSRPFPPDGFDSELHEEGGMILVGENGGIWHPEMRPDSPRLYPESKWVDYRADPSLRVPRSIPRVKGGITGDWVDSIREGRRACSDFEYSGPLTELILLGTLAIRTGNPVRWDGDALEVLGNSEAATLVKTEARPGWRVEDLTG